MTGSAAGRFPGRAEQSHPVRSLLPEVIRDQTVAVVGRGRLGTAVTSAFRTAGVQVSGPHGRGFTGGGSQIILLCVPDDHIAQAAAMVPRGPFVGHCSGAMGLQPLQPFIVDGRAFSVHPLITATAAGAQFAGACAAVAGSSDSSAAVANALAGALGMQPFSVAEADRPAYHAAAAMAANFLITVQWAAGRLLQSASVDPAVVLPLARQALDNWADLGPAALTGPVARGDLGTVAVHRDAVAKRVPDLIGLFDELVSATRTLARSTVRPTTGHEPEEGA